MIQTTESVRTYFGNTAGRTFDTYLVDDNAQRIDCEIKSLKLYKGSGNKIGSVFASYMEAAVSDYSGGDITGEKIYVYTAVPSIANSAVLLGCYVVTECVGKGTETTISAVGYLGAYCNDQIEISSGGTIQDAIDAIEQETSLTINVVTAAQSRLSEEFPGTAGSIRAVLGAIAKALGCFCTDGHGGSIEITRWKASSATTAAQMSIIPGVSTKNIQENEIQDEQTSIENSIVSINYYPAKSQWVIGNPLLTPEDEIILCEALDSQGKSIPVFELTHTYNGGWQSYISCLTESQNKRTAVKGPITEEVKALGEGLEKAFDSIAANKEWADEQALEAYEHVNEYITDNTSAGIMVHPKQIEGYTPEEVKQTGWKISNVLELLIKGSSYIKAGIENAVSTLRIGLATAGHVLIKASGVDIYGGDGTVKLCHIGYGETHGATGTVDAPFYSFGERRTGSNIGSHSMAEGDQTEASGVHSHAEGYQTEASGSESHAEGEYTTASGSGAHAEGGYTEATRLNAHAEGLLCKATADNAHAEGSRTTASGSGAHAEGEYTEASGSNAHAEGNYCIADAPNQHVEGQYNATNANMLHITGIGTSDNNRVNGFAVDKNGNIYIKGHIYYGCNDDSTGGTMLV